MTLKFLKKQKGFTLIEVFAAVIILGLAYVAILQSFSVSLTNIDRLDRSASLLLNDVLEFERLLHPGEDEEEGEGEVFIEGDKYKLILIANEKKDLMSLKLEKLYE
ncbi:MAG: type II secretion system protein [Desulfobulbaceae bacterium]|nr:type II secretion system protein [Desulfobulbaceae bacterium]